MLVCLGVAALQGLTRAGQAGNEPRCCTAVAAAHKAWAQVVARRAHGVPAPRHKGGDVLDALQVGAQPPPAEAPPVVGHRLAGKRVLCVLYLILCVACACVLRARLCVCLLSTGRCS